MTGPLVTVTTVEQVAVPPGPVNVPVNVVCDAAEGRMLREPDKSTLPMWEIVPEVALLLVQLKVTLPPTCMAAGLAVRVQEGGGG